jgi:ABC-type phosphate/phosphonate transport system substrate-binding protein
MAFNILLVWKKLPSLRLSGFYMLPRQFFFVYPPQHLRSGITFPIIKINQTDAIHIGFERRYLSAFYDFTKMSRMIGQVTEYIKEWTGYDLNVVEYIYSEDLKTDFLAGRLDLVISDNQSFKDFYQTKTAEPLVTFIMNKKDYQNEWLFYQKTEPRQAISDFKNKRIGFLNPNSLAYLKQNVAGYQIDYFKEFKRIHDAKSAVLALCLKEVDAVVASGYLLNVYDRVETAAPKTLEKIVLPGSMIPNPPIYRRTMMNQSKLKLINQFMKKMKEVEVESSVQQFFNFLKIDGIDKFEIQKYKKYY